MSGEDEMLADGDDRQDTAPGDRHGDGHAIRSGLLTYLVGFGLASVLTILSFATVGTSLVYGPAIPVALVALAVAQMGVHLVFFLHINSGPDNTNNLLALAFGTLIVVLVIGGSLWIMANLNANMMPMHELMQMQR